jgi:micrococcal nuclease
MARREGTATAAVGAVATAAVGAVATAVAALTAAALLAACGRLAPNPPPGDARARVPPVTAAEGGAVVTKVVDGDTVRVRLSGRDDEERVRLIGIDTPETHGPGGLRECFGREAAARMAALLPPGTEVRLERDAELRDRYGRLLAYVYRASDDLFVNLALAREGFAAALTVPPNVAHEQDFAAAAADARSADRGLWGRCGSPDVAVDSPP